MLTIQNPDLQTTDCARLTAAIARDCDLRNAPQDSREARLHGRAELIGLDLAQIVHIAGFAEALRLLADELDGASRINYIFARKLVGDPHSAHIDTILKLAGFFPRPDIEANVWANVDLRAHGLVLPARHLDLSNYAVGADEEGVLFVRKDQD